MTHDTILSIQRDLQSAGLYHGRIDGDWGPRTNEAYFTVLRRKGTIIPPWLLVAQGELGQRELPGPAHNPRIVKYHVFTSLHASDDETPWCSAFENFIMQSSSLPGTNSAAARSWLSWGRSLSSPRVGAVAVFTRGTPSSGLGHVTNVIHWDDSHLLCLGGNQGDAVSVAIYPRTSLLGLRWPDTSAFAQSTAKLAV